MAKVRFGLSEHTLGAGLARWSSRRASREQRRASLVSEELPLPSLHDVEEIRRRDRAERDQDAVSDAQPTRPKRPLRAHILALIAAFAVTVAATGLWILALRAGPPIDGFVAGPMVVAVPFLLVFGIFLWACLRAGIWIRWTALSVLAAAFAFALVAVALICGSTACFTPGSNRMLGWFVVGGIAAAALVHHLVLETMSGVSRHVV